MKLELSIRVSNLKASRYPSRSCNVVLFLGLFLFLAIVWYANSNILNIYFEFRTTVYNITTAESRDFQRNIGSLCYCHETVDEIW